MPVAQLSVLKYFFYFSAKCTELPEAPQNGMVVAPKLDHGMVGKFECRDGYMLKGHNTTQCFFGNWTGMTPWCKEGNPQILIRADITIHQKYVNS